MALFATNFPKPLYDFAELRLSHKAAIEGSDNLALQKIAPLIHQIRGERVILDPTWPVFTESRRSG